MNFDIHQPVVDPDTGEYDEDAAIRYEEQLSQLFAEAPEGIAYVAQGGELGSLAPFLRYGMSYLGRTPAEMSVRDVEEVLFELFPRKVAVGPEEAGNIVAEQRAFWTFLGRVYQLPNAPAVLRLLDDGAARRLERELGNPANFGMAKSMVMEGQARGFDTSTQEGLEAWMHAYNAEHALGSSELRHASLGRVTQPARKSKSASTAKNRRKMAKASRKQNRRR